MSARDKVSVRPVASRSLAMTRDSRRCRPWSATALDAMQANCASPAKRDCWATHLSGFQAWLRAGSRPSEMDDEPRYVPVYPTPSEAEGDEEDVRAGCLDILAATAGMGCAMSVRGLILVIAIL